MSTRYGKFWGTAFDRHSAFGKRPKRNPSIMEGIVRAGRNDGSHRPQDLGLFQRDGRRRRIFDDLDHGS
jgi:hypothetical protein